VFSAKGAMRRFNALLEAAGRLGEWQDFESRAQERVLREWAEANQLELGSR
jgi:hypothetical protein